MIVLDASLLIAHLDARDAHHGRATDLLLDAAGRPLGASVVTVAEVLVGPARTGRLEAADAALRELGVEHVAVGPEAGSQLATLRATTGLKLPDCCVLLAARSVEAQALATFDDGLRGAAAGAGLDVLP